MSRPRHLPPTLRLALGLSTSGFLLTATAGGPWAFAPSALLWAAPFLVAARCLPLRAALPLVLLIGAAARAVVGGGDLVAASVASASLLPLLLLDKAVEHRLPRASLLVWPLAMVGMTALVSGTSWGGLVSPAPAQGILAEARDLAGPWVVPLVAALVGQAFGALGTVHNRRDDRFAAAEREAGVRWAAIVGLFLPTAVLLVVLALRPS